MPARNDEAVTAARAIRNITLLEQIEKVAFMT
jgi:hypothetical protein